MWEFDGKHLSLISYEKKRVEGDLALDGVKGELCEKNKCPGCREKIVGSVFCGNPEGPYYCSFGCAAKTTRWNDHCYVWEYDGTSLQLITHKRQNVGKILALGKLNEILARREKCAACKGVIAWSVMFRSLDGPHYCGIECALKE